jgi:hypothetical protein
LPREKNSWQFAIDLPRNRTRQSKLPETENHSKSVAICHGLAIEIVELVIHRKLITNKGVKKYAKN